MLRGHPMLPVALFISVKALKKKVILIFEGCTCFVAIWSSSFHEPKNDVCSHSSEITQTNSQQKSSHFEMINSENHIVLYIRFERLVRDSYKAKPEIDL